QARRVGGKDRRPARARGVRAIAAVRSDSDKETRRQGEGETRRDVNVFFLLVSLSPCLLVWFIRDSAMPRIQAPSRLHFGLLSVAAESAPWPDRLGRPALPARRFGGVGLMVESPGILLTTCPAPAWSAEGPLSERALAFARHFSEQIRTARGADLPDQHLRIEQAAPEHAGLGTG